MLVDGKTIALEVLETVKQVVISLGRTPHLSAITCAPNFETRKYVEMKRSRAAAVGIVLNVIELPADVTLETAIAHIKEAAATSDGVVVQLPFPPQIDRTKLLRAVPVAQDPDGFQYGQTVGACLSPVVGAIDEISKKYGVPWQGQQVVVLGEGLLVGRPAAAYARAKGANVTILTKENYDSALLRPADIIISGIGQPNFIKSEFVKEGVVIFDAGTSEEGGVLVGDVDPMVAEKAALFTPVPGGIGPITIAYLLSNLVSLMSNKIE